MILESLNWRYATKKYNADKKVSDADLQTLKNAIQLSVSSMGLQPYKVIFVADPKLREQLKPAAFSQSAITDASHLIIFAHETNVGEKQISTYLQNIAATRGISIDSLNGFRNSMTGFVGQLSTEENSDWARRQTYIALSTLINTAALLKIDATPMEGYDRAEFDRILGLDKLQLSAGVIATIGYRHSEDATQHLKKVRKPESELFLNL